MVITLVHVDYTSSPILVWKQITTWNVKMKKNSYQQILLFYNQQTNFEVLPAALFDAEPKVFRPLPGASLFILLS